MEQKPLTVKHYQDALAVQDACNLSGVVHAFSRVLTDLHNDPSCEGTKWVAEHPITRLYVDKIDSLVRYGEDTVSDAYTIVFDVIGGKIEP